MILSIYIDIWHHASSSSYRKSVLLTRSYKNRIHFIMIKFILRIHDTKKEQDFERERERERVLTNTGIHQHGSNSFCALAQLFTSWF